MHTVRESSQVPFRPTQIFDLVADVESYPDFLPWCRGARVLSRSADATEAELKVGYGPVSAPFTARAEMARPEEIRLRLVKGLFSSFQGTWRFDPLPTGGTRVCLDLTFEFLPGRIGRLLTPFFRREAASMVRAFRRRAERLYGREEGPAATPE